MALNSQAANQNVSHLLAALLDDPGAIIGGLLHEQNGRSPRPCKSNH